MRRGKIVHQILLTCRSLSAAVYGCVARIAQRDQVLLRVRAREAPKVLMVDLKVGHRAAELTSPTVTTQHLGAQSVVLFRLDPHG
jgi:hypothetical protein